MSAIAAPEPGNVGFLSAFKRPSVRILTVSRASSKLAQATVSYGTMVYLAGSGGSQLQVSMVAASTYLSALLFGLQGGTLADSLSKRMAIVAGYILLAIFTIATPLVLGTGASQLVLLMFVSSALMQIVSPSLKSAIALVSSPSEMATVAASVSVVGSIASAFGSSFLAPILIKRTSIDVVLYVAGAIYLLGAIRAIRLPREESSLKLKAAMDKVDWRPKALSRRATAEWLISHRNVGILILVGGICVALFEAFNTLIPVYVRDVLETDPANAVWIFAPAGIGFLIGTFLTPKLIGTIGARKLAIVAAIIMAISMMLFGLIDWVAPIFAPISPLRILGWLFGLTLSDKMLAASVIAIPANFGSTAAGASVQTYINSKVPVINQGSTFGMQEVQENIFTLLLVVMLGIMSTVFGSRAVFVVAPIIVVSMVVALIRYSYHVSGGHDVTRREAFSELMGSDDEETDSTETMNVDTP